MMHIITKGCKSVVCLRNFGGKQSCFSAIFAELLGRCLLRNSFHRLDVRADIFRKFADDTVEQAEIKISWKLMKNKRNKKYTQVFPRATHSDYHAASSVRGWVNALL